jgi:DNA-binding protein H-NS
MTINLKRLTPKQLDDLTRQIEAHKSERRSSHLAVVRAKAEAIARAAGLTLEDVFPRSGKKRRVAAARSTAIPPTTRRPGPAVVVSRAGSRRRSGRARRSGRC